MFSMTAPIYGTFGQIWTWKHIEQLLKVSIFRKGRFCQNRSTYDQVIRLEKCKPNSGTPCIVAKIRYKHITHICYKGQILSFPRNPL